MGGCLEVEKDVVEKDVVEASDMLHAEVSDHGAQDVVEALSDMLHAEVNDHGAHSWGEDYSMTAYVTMSSGPDTSSPPIEAS